MGVGWAKAHMLPSASATVAAAAAAAVAAAATVACAADNTAGFCAQVLLLLCPFVSNITPHDSLMPTATPTNVSDGVPKSLFRVL